MFESNESDGMERIAENRERMIESSLQKKGRVRE